MNNLNSELGWMILKYLEYPDYRNMAFTCRNWFLIASSAPDYVKPVVFLDCVVAPSNEDFMVVQPKYRVLNNKNVFLFKKVKCRKLFLNMFTEPDLLLLIHRNKTLFEIELLEIELPSSKESVVLAIDSNVSSEVYIRSFPIPDNYLLDLNISYLYNHVLFENNLSCNVITHNDCKSLEPAKVVLQQWIRGERPLLKRFSSHFFIRFSDIMDYVTSGLESFVIKKQSSYLEEKAVQYAEVRAPNLALLSIRICENSIQYERINCSNV